MLAGRTTAEALVAERQREAHLSLYGHPLLRFTMNEVRSAGMLTKKLQTAGIRQTALPTWLNDSGAVGAAKSMHRLIASNYLGHAFPAGSTPTETVSQYLSASKPGCSFPDEYALAESTCPGIRSRNSGS